MTAADRPFPGVRRLRADNPGPLTGTGTNSYLVCSGSERPAGRRAAALIDPGPDDARHRAAILAAAAEEGVEIVAILVSHAHRDHSEGASALAAATGAETWAFGRYGDGARPAMRARVEAGLLRTSGGGEGADRDFTPVQRLGEGARVVDPDGGWALVATHTPGHLADHMAFALEAPAGRPTGALFTGDTVMGWATSLVSPPEGDMTAYMATLGRLAERADQVYLPGHGEPVTDPAARLAALVAHRRSRERSVLGAVRAALPADGAAAPLAAITRHAYADTPNVLLAAAERNALAHLLDLAERGLVALEGGGDRPIGARPRA